MPAYQLSVLPFDRSLLPSRGRICRNKKFASAVLGGDNDGHSRLVRRAIFITCLCALIGRVVLRVFPRKRTHLRLPPPPCRQHWPRPKKGGAAAQFRMGMMFLNGKEVAGTLRWPRPGSPKAAEQNHPAAQFNFAVLYTQGAGVPQNYPEAAKWFQRAADQNDPAAQYNRGIHYANGAGVAKDMTICHLPVPQGWRERRCPRRNGACIRAGERHWHSRRSLPEAYFWFHAGDGQRRSLRRGRTRQHRRENEPDQLFRARLRTANRPATRKISIRLGSPIRKPTARRTISPSGEIVASSRHARTSRSATQARPRVPERYRHTDGPSRKPPSGCAPLPSNVTSKRNTSSRSCFATAKAWRRILRKPPNGFLSRRGRGRG